MHGNAELTVEGREKQELPLTTCHSTQKKNRCSRALGVSPLKSGDDREPPHNRRQTGRKLGFPIRQKASHRFP